MIYKENIYIYHVYKATNILEDVHLNSKASTNQSYRCQNNFCIGLMFRRLIDLFGCLQLNIAELQFCNVSAEFLLEIKSQCLYIYLIFISTDEIIRIL